MPDPLAILTDRLYTDYQPGLTHSDIDRVVKRCRAELAGTPDTALPELLERLARQRLNNQRDNDHESIASSQPYRCRRRQGPCDTWRSLPPATARSLDCAWLRHRHHSPRAHQHDRHHLLAAVVAWSAAEHEPHMAQAA
jgi:hypothetical protein